MIVCGWGATHCRPDVNGVLSMMNCRSLLGSSLLLTLIAGSSRRVRAAARRALLTDRDHAAAAYQQCWVLVQVDLGVPDAERPDCGHVQFAAECSPCAGPRFWVRTEPRVIFDDVQRAARCRHAVGANRLGSG